MIVILFKRFCFLTLRYYLLLWSIHRIYYAALKMFKIFDSAAVEIKLFDSNILVKSNINLFVEFTNCNLSRAFFFWDRSRFLILYQSCWRTCRSFPITVLNRAWKLGLDFSLQSLELYSCIQFEIRKLVWWFCYTSVKPRTWQCLQPRAIRTNKPDIHWWFKTTVLPLKCLIIAASVVSSGDAEGV